MSAKTATAPEWVRDVLEFWYQELGEREWFAKSEPIDGMIRARFRELHDRLATGHQVDVSDPRQVLAAVIVLDQFSRHIFRDTPQAFAADPIALRLARLSVERGFDRAMTPEERLFVYMPFQHSENREDQELSVDLVAQLGNEEWQHYARAHQSIIDRFGRFPHRNSVLGRTSTPDELALLDEPMGSF